MSYKHISEYYSIDEILAGAEVNDERTTRDEHDRTSWNRRPSMCTRGDSRRSCTHPLICPPVCLVVMSRVQMVPAITQHVACDLGWMDEQTVDEVDLPSESRVEMPWWLACQLAGRNSIALDLPRMLQPTYRAMVLAEPEVVDLQAKAPFFYEFGMMYADLIRELEIGSMLCAVMDCRYKEIVKRTVNRKQTESQEFVARLCNMERKCQTPSTHTACIAFTPFAADHPHSFDVLRFPPLQCTRPKPPVCCSTRASPTAPPFNSPSRPSSAHSNRTRPSNDNPPPARPPPSRTRNAPLRRSSSRTRIRTR
jgi:hypothetical protein